jgi:hypothetical protein
VIRLYDIKLDTETNTLLVTASGFFKEEDAKVYISEFQTIVNTINPKHYKLIIDASGQEAVENHVLEDIKFVLQLYSSARFKKVVIINPLSKTSQLQIENCAKEINFEADFVTTIDEAYIL